MAERDQQLGKLEIESKIPHRGRALLIDTFEIDQERNIGVGYLNVTQEICEGHFPDNPIMRGFDRLEMIALTLGLYSLADLPEGKFPYLATTGKSRFPGLVVPGDEVRAEVNITKKTSKRIQGSGKAYVGEKLVAEVEDIMCLIGDAPKK